MNQNAYPFFPHYMDDSFLIERYCLQGWEAVKYGDDSPCLKDRQISARSAKISL